MITEWFISLGVGIADWFLGLFGEDEPPVWLDGIADFFADLATRAAGLGAWIPWPLFVTVATFVLALWSVFWIVKGVRWIWGLTPFSGGS